MTLRLPVVDLGTWQNRQITLLLRDLPVLGPLQNAIKVLALVPGVRIRDWGWVSLDPVVQLHAGIGVAHQNLAHHFDAVVYRTYQS